MMENIRDSPRQKLTLIKDTECRITQGPLPPCKFHRPLCPPRIGAPPAPPCPTGSRRCTTACRGSSRSSGRTGRGRTCSRCDRRSPRPLREEGQWVIFGRLLSILSWRYLESERHGNIQGRSLILGSMVLCVFCFESCTPEGRGEKRGVQISK